MKFRKYIFIGLFAIFTCLFSACESAGPESLGSKEEYGILKALKATQTETMLDPKLEIVESKDYWCAGFPSIDRKAKVWVMLNAKHSPYYKQVGGGTNYWISEIDFQALKSKNVCSATVLSVFQSRVGP